MTNKFLSKLQLRYNISSKGTVKVITMKIKTSVPKELNALLGGGVDKSGAAVKISLTYCFNHIKLKCILRLSTAYTGLIVNEAYTVLRVSANERSMHPKPAFSVNFSWIFRHWSHVGLSPVANPLYKYLQSIRVDNKA